MKLNDFLLAYFTSDYYEPLRMSELADRFGLQGEARLEFYRLIDQMLDEEKIKMSKRGRIKAYHRVLAQDETNPPLEMWEKAPDFDVSFAAPVAKIQNQQEHQKQEEIEKPSASENASGSASERPSDLPSDLIVGQLRGNPKGFAFLIPDDTSIEDVFIRGDQLQGALHGDRVAIRVTEDADPASDRNATGEVVKILERNQEPVVGLFQKEDGYGFVVPDRKQNFIDIYVAEENAMGAQDQDKVIVEIQKVDPQQKNPEGRIVEVIGRMGEKGVDITSVARQFDLPYVFSPEALQEAEDLPEEVDPSERRGRKDLRKKFTVTIDGADAKDFDDAISVERRGKYYNLYVHIADVSHYVKEGSALDLDAYERGNSVYLLDRVIPMLPEKLSNGLCSLNPGVERLAMTTQVTLDEDGTILDHQFYPSVIVSDHRLVYDDVSDYIEHGRIFNDDDRLYEALDVMHEIYQRLAEKREERGTLDFEFPETSIQLDENGVPVQIGLEERRVANRIIEEFMILNNVVVGTAFLEKKLPFIYRVHEAPEAEHVERLNRALSTFHYDPVSEEPAPAELRRILDRSVGTKEHGILNMLVLQSMTKAEYRAEALLHYGLAVAQYSHFTAPIRRYADLIAHRLLKALLDGTPQTGEDLTKKLAKQSAHISETERKAEEAERDVVDMKSAEYMQQFIGQAFDGIITSLTNFGVFVMLENTVEGLAHFRDMTDDYYSYDEEHLVVRGERNHRELHYGDAVRVLLVGANPLLREIDFHLVGFSGDGQTPRRSAPKRSRSRSLDRAPAMPGQKKRNRNRKNAEGRQRNRLSNRGRHRKKR